MGIAIRIEHSDDPADGVPHGVNGLLTEQPTQMLDLGEKRRWHRCTDMLPVAEEVRYDQPVRREPRPHALVAEAPEESVHQYDRLHKRTVPTLPRR